MINIITETDAEYAEMMEFAENHVCIHMPSGSLCKTTCDECYKENHLNCGIQVIRERRRDLTDTDFLIKALAKFVIDKDHKE